MLTTNRRAARVCSLLMAALLVITGFAGCGKPTKPTAITPKYQSSFVDQLMNIDQSGPNEKVWLIDFSAYKEPKDIPGAYVCLNVTMRKTYTFSFDYIRISGPLSLDSIRLNTGGNPLLCDRNALHIGANVTVEGTAPGIVSGYQGAQSASLNSNAQKEQVTVDGGSFDRVYLGARATQTAIPYSVVNGVDFTLNGGQVQQVAVGADGWSGYAGYNVYTGNVNITVNGGTVNRVRIIDRNDISDSVRSQLNGNAVQLILNNGSSIATNELNAAAVETLGGVFYQLECAAQEGSRLETTDTAGTYRVVGDKAAVAKDGSHVYTSEDGLLTVPAGSYTVGWSSGQNTVYVSAAGADTADGKTPETAVATMDRAFALLEAQQAEAKTVKIVGSYTLSKHLPTHTESISIEGYDENAVLTPTRSIRINGPTVFDRVRFNAGGYMFCCDRNELTMGEQVTMTSTDFAKGLYVDSGYYNAYDASCNQNPQKERITIHNGLYYMVRLGAEYAVTPSVEVNGVDFTLIGGSLYKLYIGAYGDNGRKGYCNYTDNVNITLNGGSIKDRLAVSDVDGQSKLNLSDSFQSGSDHPWRKLPVGSSDSCDWPETQSWQVMRGLRNETPG